MSKPVAFKHVEKICEYLDYVENHIRNVVKAWEILKDKCQDMKFISDDFYYHTINQMILAHDVSKLSHEEDT